jgi:hypothetical protein
MMIVLAVMLNLNLFFISLFPFKKKSMHAKPHRNSEKVQLATPNQRGPLALRRRITPGLPKNGTWIFSPQNQKV